jgi:DNA mismatch repair protein MutS
LGKRSGWVYPTIDESRDLILAEGRHPLVEEALGSKFVPNDFTLLGEERRILLITGPNMGGKSTVMRQVALAILLGQMGGPVPAREARWGVVGSLYTRIGANDAISKGQSTFMVEMSELAHILHHADDRSFIVLDEIGRGTSTYDGISVAWSALEWLAHKVRARTVFATHYHELTRLSDSLEGVVNTHVAVDSTGGILRFLYRLTEGASSESFGIQVAQLAGLPPPVIARAWEVMADLDRRTEVPEELHSVTNSLQLSFFDTSSERRAPETPAPTPAQPTRDPLLQGLLERNVNEMTPIQALHFVLELQEKSRALEPKFS